MAAVTQLRHKHSDGRATSNARSPRARPTRSPAVIEATRQQRRLPPTPRRREPSRPLITEGPGGQEGTTRSQRDRSRILTTGSSAKPLPDPPSTLRQPAPPVEQTRPRTSWEDTLDTERIRSEREGKLWRAVVLRCVFCVSDRPLWTRRDGAGGQSSPNTAKLSGGRCEQPWAASTWSIVMRASACSIVQFGTTTTLPSARPSPT